MDEYRIERFSIDKIDDFLWLFEESFNTLPIKSRFLKKFDTEYVGISHIAFIAYDLNNLPAAFYGIFPCVYNLNGKKCLGAQSGDTMTHPNHRKKGLFYELAKRTYNQAKDLGVNYIYGVPNGNSYHGFKKMGWSTPYTITEFEKKLNPTIISKISKRLAPNWFKERVNENWLKKSIKGPIKCSREGGFHVLRNHDYYNYKKYNKNDVLGFKSGQAWMSYKYFDLVLGDFKLYDGANAMALIREIEAFGKKIGCSKIICYEISDLMSGKTLSSEGYNEVNKCHVITLNQGLDIKNPLSISATDFDTF
tara:strand:+ start:63 stop:983 length:921 start_codon:yes stop_codon:yes gene_type:complete